MTPVPARKAFGGLAQRVTGVPDGPLQRGGFEAGQWLQPGCRPVEAYRAVVVFMSQAS